MKFFNSTELSEKYCLKGPDKLSVTLFGAQGHQGAAAIIPQINTVHIYEITQFVKSR
jgi:protein involved in polysaccharide export with SLBB domain